MQIAARNRPAGYDLNMPNYQDDPSAGSPSLNEPLLRLRQEGFAARGIDDETVVLDLRTSTYLATNQAGTLLWRCLERGARRSDLIAAVLDEFEVDRAQAEKDVDDFIADCRRRGLVSE